MDPFHAKRALTDIFQVPRQSVLSYIDYVDDSGHVTPILPVHGKMLFGGEAKIGKSWVCLELIRAILTGEPPFGGPFKTSMLAENVLYLEQELSEDGFFDRRKVFEGVPEDKLDKLWVCSQNRELDLSLNDGYEHISRLIEETQANVCVLDPFAKFHTSDENNAQEMGFIFKRLDNLIRKFSSQNLALVYAHHTKKPQVDVRAQEDRLSAYAFRGTSRFFDDVDTLMTAKFHESKSPFKKTPGGDKWWRLQTRWETRRGQGIPEDIGLAINKYEDLRVTYDGVIHRGDVEVKAGKKDHQDKDDDHHTTVPSGPDPVRWSRLQ